MDMQLEEQNFEFFQLIGRNWACSRVLTTLIFLKILTLFGEFSPRGGQMGGLTPKCTYTHRAAPKLQFLENSLRSSLDWCTRANLA